MQSEAPVVVPWLAALGPGGTPGPGSGPPGAGHGCAAAGCPPRPRLAPTGAAGWGAGAAGAVGTGGGHVGVPPPVALSSVSACGPLEGSAAAWGLSTAPPGPPHILRLPFTFPWQGTVSLIIKSWWLEEAKGSGGPQGRLLGRAVARQHLSPGGPWRGGTGGGLHFGTCLRCRPPARGPRCVPRCAPCTR
ncbi:delta-like protein 3, partial [Aquila chrysaetos chrysaetos]|uniref:delta-like protein 3 n=1 Tax=Aquila chrysaetos chrysaetos TaxID=223781 RepID=UPI001B7D42CA